jgi:hypothetical protein
MFESRSATTASSRRPGRVPATSLAVSLLALILAGCVNAGITNAPSGPSAPNGSSAGGLSSASASAPIPVPVASGDIAMVITIADNGKTLHLSVGQRFAVSLGAGSNVTVSDPNVVQRVAAPLASGVDAVFQAVAPGSTTLSGAWKPACASGAVCPLYLIYFSVTVIVS